MLLSVVAPHVEADGRMTPGQIQRFGFVIAAKTLCPDVAYQPAFDDKVMRKLATYYLTEAPSEEQHFFRVGTDGFTREWKKDRKMACRVAVDLSPYQLRLVP